MEPQNRQIIDYQSVIAPHRSVQSPEETTEIRNRTSASRIVPLVARLWRDRDEDRRLQKGTGRSRDICWNQDSAETMDILETHAYDRRQKRNTSCTLFFSLSPFFLATALFFYLWTPEFPASITLAGVKAAPVLLLAVIVLSWSGGQSVLGVVGGLLFSAVGDCCLVWPEYFLHGMGAFGVAHLLYSLSFLTSHYATYSSSSWSRVLYLILLVVAGGFYTYLYPFLKKDPRADILVPAVGGYTGLITLMGALAIRTRHTLTLLGSLSFMLSDMSLALQVFNVMSPIKQGHIVVMVTYYLAQLLIAVGDIKATETRDDFSKWKRS